MAVLVSLGHCGPENIWTSKYTNFFGCWWDFAENLLHSLIKRAGRKQQTCLFEVTPNKHEMAFPYACVETAPNLSHSLLCSVGLGTHGAYRKAE